MNGVTSNNRTSLGTLSLAAVVILLVILPSISAQQSFEEWQAQQDAAFQSFISEEDAAFSEFLKTEWEQFEAFLESGFYAEPKLEAPPRTDAATRTGDRARVTLSRRPLEQNDAVVDDPLRPEQISVTFHGLQISLPVPEDISSLRLEAVSPDGFSDYWDAATTAGVADLAAALAAAAERRELNDYGTFQLVTLVAEHLFAREQDRAAATWYLMVKNGFDMRVAYSGATVALLLPSPNTLYSTAYFSIDDRRYYILRANGEPFRERMRWRTYAGDFPGSDREIRLELPDTLGIPSQTRREQLKFTYRGSDYRIEVPVNELLIEYLADYPYTDWWVHFFPPTSSETREALVREMGSLVAGRTPADAANMLLRFVQTAFPYQTDQEQFGVEKWQAPEEILYYRRSDCDDRSILYAFLLREVLGWDDVAMLRYPGHLAVAVPQRRLGVSGDSVRVHGENYIVTDPTYIGADIGMAMPQFRNVRPEVSVIRRR